MTSWKRGKQHENKGDRMMDSPEVGEKVKGAALKAAGMVEQGIDNVKDRVTGEQKDLQGKEHKGASHSRARSSHAKASSATHSREASHTAHDKRSGGASASHPSSRSK